MATAEPDLRDSCTSVDSSQLFMLSRKGLALACRMLFLISGVLPLISVYGVEKRDALYRFACNRRRMSR
jgi:hypothetical protein